MSLSPTSSAFPREIPLYSGGVWLYFSVGTTEEEIAKKLFITTERPDSKSWWVCAFNGIKFEVLQAYLWIANPEGELWRLALYPHSDTTVHSRTAIDDVMMVYRPVDPRIRRIDAHKATRAYQNADRSGWLFEHVNEGEHHDHYLNAHDSVIVRFQRAINAADIKEREAPAGPTKTAALAKLKNLVAFRDDAADAVVEAEQREHLGHFAQTDPEVGHVHDAVRKAVAATKAKWALNPQALARYRDIAPLVVPIIRALATTHTPDPRWVQAEKRALRGEEVDGYEYIYASSTDGAAITGDANLPDPEWAFDHAALATGTARGTATYYDGRPTDTAPSRPFALPFRRPIPPGTSAGADIGSVAWEAMKPVRLIPE